MLTVHHVGKSTTQLIENLWQRSDAQPPNTRAINRVLWQVLVINLFVAGAKIAVGTIVGSISMVADGFHSALDGASNIIGLIGTKLAGRPPDHNHPYGHHKYETFATLTIGLLLLLTSWNVLQSVFTRFFSHVTLDVSLLSIGVMLGTILLNLFVTTYEQRQGRQLNSSLLLADAAHTKSDIFVSLSVLVSLGAASLGWPWVDSAVALIIVAVIAYTGWQIVRQASDVLTDTAVIDTALVEQIALSVDGVHSCHKIRSRGNAQSVHLDLHIQLDGQMSLAEAHYLGHQTQDRLQAYLNITDVIVHVEPSAYELI
ncbi:MAG: cation diffusion facilitator family transporter [Chloroflexota bacterium]